MHMAINWKEIHKNYRGLWVALENTVVASGKTAEEALENAKKLGHHKPIIALLPDELPAGFVSAT